MSLFDSTFDWLEAHTIPCPFKSLTGCDCPGCGLQRSILSLLKGDFVGSFEMHPAGIPFVVLVIFILLQIKFKWTFAPKVMAVLMILILMVSIIQYMYRWHQGVICG